MSNQGGSHGDRPFDGIGIDRDYYDQTAPAHAPDQVQDHNVYGSQQQAADPNFTAPAHDPNGLHLGAADPFAATPGEALPVPVGHANRPADQYGNAPYAEPYYAPHPAGVAYDVGGADPRHGQPTGGHDQVGAVPSAYEHHPGHAQFEHSQPNYPETGYSQNAYREGAYGGTQGYGRPGEFNPEAQQSADPFAAAPSEYGHRYPVDGHHGASEAAREPLAPTPVLRGADYSDPVHGDLGYGAPSHPADPTELNADPYRLDAYAPASLPAADQNHQQYDHATGAAPGFGRRGAIVGAAATAYGDAGHNEPDFGHHEAHYGAEGYDQSGGQSGGLQPHETAYVDDEDEFEDETPAKGRRSQTLVYVAASLIGAVVLGGGAAFAYKNFVGNGGAQTGPVSPIIRAGSDDTKATPTKPGGTRFAHKDSKLLGRLDSANPARGGSTQARSRAAADRVRTVSTHVVRPDGTLVPSGGATATRQPARPAPQAAAAPSIPGMVIDGLPRIPTGSVPTRRAPAGAARTIAPTTPRAPSRQIQVARVQPRTAPVRPSPVRPSARQAPSAGSRTVAPIVITRPRAPSAPAVAAPAAQQTSQRAVRPAATRTRGIPLPTRNTFPRRTRTASLAPSTVQPSRVTPAGTASVRQPVSAPATPAATSIAAGYGVVLASQNSRLAALQTFVDLRQRFAGVLGNRIPDVQEADLSSRGLGTVYRLVVGPPGSREAANTLCQQLKSGGYQDCWVKRY